MTPLPPQKYKVQIVEKSKKENWRGRYQNCHNAKLFI